MSLSTSDFKQMQSRERFGFVIILLTIAIVAGFVAAIEPFALEGIRYFSPMRLQMALVERDLKQGASINVLAVGDSHTGLGFDSLDPRVRSIGYAGEAIPEMSVKLEIILNEAESIKTVFLQAQPHMFFKHRSFGVRAPYKELTQGKGVFHPFERMFVQFDPCCRGRMLGFAAGHWLAYLSPEASARWFPSPPAPDPEVKANGFSIYKDNPKMPSDRKVQAQNEFDSYSSFTPVPALRSAYETMIQSLTRRSIQVILTHYPLASEYLEGMPRETWDEARVYFARMRDQYKLDECGAWDAFQGRQELFLNSDHLNEAGAQAYWSVLAECLKPTMADVRVTTAN